MVAVRRKACVAHAEMGFDQLYARATWYLEPIRPQKALRPVAVTRERHVSVVHLEECNGSYEEKIILLDIYLELAAMLSARGNSFG